MPLMTIAQAARAAGISPKMARHYESLGLFVPAARSGTGYRLYGAPEVRRLRIIGRARDLGFPLPSIARMLHADADERQGDIGKEIDSRIAQAEHELQRLMNVLEALRSLEASLGPFDRGDCPAALARAQRRAAALSGERARQPVRDHDRGLSGAGALFEAWGVSPPTGRQGASAGSAPGAR